VYVFGGFGALTPAAILATVDLFAVFAADVLLPRPGIPMLGLRELRPPRCEDRKVSLVALLGYVRYKKTGSWPVVLRKKRRIAEKS